MRNIDQSGCVLLRRILHQQTALKGRPPAPYLVQLGQHVIDSLPAVHHVMDPVTRIENGDLMQDWFNLRLPFKTMWVEGVAPGMRVGCYVMESDDPAIKSNLIATHSFAMVAFAQRHDWANPMLTGLVWIDTDDAGDVIDMRPNTKVDNGFDPGTDENAHYQMMCCYPAAQTIAMMNDPKITTVEINHDRAIRKKFRHNEVPNANTRYSVLILKDELERVGGKIDPANPGTMPLHVVKGHWGRYGVDGRTGKLFGRLTGRFWFEESKRGNPAFGTVEHDYNLSPDYGKGRRARSVAAVDTAAAFAAAMDPTNVDRQVPQRQEARQ